MNEAALRKRFRSIGAEFAVIPLASIPWWRQRLSEFQVDVVGDQFEIRLEAGAKPGIAVAQVRPRERHLVLTVTTQPDPSRDRDRRTVHKYLCGYDERAWFVAALPERAAAGSVAQAKEALKPPAVREAQARTKLNGRKRNKRRNAAFVRQGEWFFVPEPDFRVGRQQIVLHHEPLTQGRGQPHMAEFLIRGGGTRVYVCERFPMGLTEPAYRTYIKQHPHSRKWPWQIRFRDANVYVKGRIRHPDHKTVRLDVWHRVAPNTESEAPTGQHMVFLD